MILLSSLCSCKSGKIFSVYNKDGKVEVQIESDYQPDKSLAYFDIAIEEAASILSKKLDCNIETAKQKIVKGQYVIYTFYDKRVQASLTQVMNGYKTEMDSAASITDLNGNLIAAYSNSLQDVDNHASKAYQPHSSFKPLSVYAQALEKGIINWSTTYEDSPYKEIENSDGTKRNWPQNANGQYSMKKTTIYNALKRSLNTVAVKCLAEVGVNDSIDFLQNKLGIPMFFEQYSSTIYTEDEIIGNVAMGALNEGVSTVDMAGYYQMFATGGVYETPKAVYKILDKGGKEIYKRKYNPKEILSPETSDLMNLLLQGVVTPGGTGANASCNDIKVAGKTGTGDANIECWFVGVTPEFSCAVWHGQLYKNIAPELFSGIIKDIYSKNSELKKNFKKHANFKSQVFCEESGMGVSSKCTSINLGYYSSKSQLEICNIH